MADAKPNYCWVKVVDLDKDDPEEIEKDRDELSICSPDRPPKIKAGWQLDKDYDGSVKANSTVEYHPMGDDRGKAIDWLASDAGKKWLGCHPVTYFLACFGS